MRHYFRHAAIAAAIDFAAAMPLPPLFRWLPDAFAAAAFAAADMRCMFSALFAAAADAATRRDIAIR